MGYLEKNLRCIVWGKNNAKFNKWDRYCCPAQRDFSFMKFEKVLRTGICPMFLGDNGA